jgi:hypothetical protein
MANDKKDPTKSTAIVPVAGAPDATNWEKEETGFAPYWKPEAKKVFFARPIGRDDRDPDFVRYQMKLEQDELACQSGPKDDATDVIVKKGDTFTVSVYVQLDDKFNEYMECGLFPIVRCEALREAKTSKPGQTCWIFDLRVSPDDKKKLASYRRERAQSMAAAASERKAIQENA